MQLSTLPTASTSTLHFSVFPSIEKKFRNSFIITLFQGLDHKGNFPRRRKADFSKIQRNLLDFTVKSASSGNGSRNLIDVQFPNDYSQLLHQAKEAVDFALKDNIQLMEIEFPTSGLESVPGDGEGANEMTESMLLIRQFCDIFIAPEKVTRTRIFFPEVNEVQFARSTVFGGVSYKLDYLTKPSFFEDFGFSEKVKMVDHVKQEDELFLVAYPYFNVNEMLVVEELFNEAVVNTPRKMIIFNGELDRIRSGYYPPFFYPKLAALTKTFLPKMETAYYIHNFKGQKGGVLFRCYPGPWKVLKRVRNKYVCLHQQDQMPSFKEPIRAGTIVRPANQLVQGSTPFKKKSCIFNPIRCICAMNMIFISIFSRSIYVLNLLCLSDYL